MGATRHRRSACTSGVGRIPTHRRDRTLLIRFNENVYETTLG